jgi:hypothetical protein
MTLWAIRTHLAGGGETSFIRRPDRDNWLSPRPRDAFSGQRDLVEAAAEKLRAKAPGRVFEVVELWGK